MLHCDLGRSLAARCVLLGLGFMGFAFLVVATGHVVRDKTKSPANKKSELVKSVENGTAASVKSVPATSARLSYNAGSRRTGRNNLVLSRNGEGLQLTDGKKSLLDSSLLAETNELFLEGSSVDDTLVIDLRHGNPIPAGGLTFDGRGEITTAGDGLVIRGGSYKTAILDYFNAKDGRIRLDGSVVNYVNLEPVSIPGGADLILNMTPGDDQAILEESGTPGQLRLRSLNATFEQTDFTIPSNSLTINMGDGNDTLTLQVNATVTTSINGDAGNDSIIFANGVGLAGGAINGGTDVDTLDYSAYTTSISSNLGLGVTGLSATLGSNQEVPANNSTATGSATISNYNLTTKTFDISVTVDGITPGIVTGFHIHRAPFGVNGPIIIDFVPGGVPIAPIVPTPTGFTFTATGVSLPVQHEAAFLGGITYVNVHTPTLPGGEIRGQLFSNGNVNLASGTSTGTNGISNVENVIGGSASDSLVGNFGANTLQGNSGNDTFVAGPGADSFQGGANDDVMVWSNGDGSDLMDGLTGTDLVQVNGSVPANDNFTVAAGPGGRVDFDRISPGPFSLDIGTVETLTVNGIGGDDTFATNSLAGVLDLTQLNLNGVDGNDTFNIIAAPTITINVNGGLPTSAVGDTLTYNAEGRVFSGDLTPPDGQVTSFGVQNVNFQQIESLGFVNAPFLSVNDISITEGNSGSQNAVFTVTLATMVAQTVTVDFFTGNGSATEPSDFTAVNGTLTFSPGQVSRTVLVPVNGDTLPEGDETFFVNLTNASNALISDAQGVGTIIDDDPGGTLQFSAATYTVNENGGSATITVNRTGSTLGIITVNFTTSNGTANAGSDYGLSAGTLTFDPGETNQTFSVPIIDDNTSEGTESVNLTLSGPTGGATLGSQSTAVLLILDNEPPPANSVTVFAVTLNNNLVSFNSAAPETILNTVAITGLQSGETILVIDFRPATGQLFGLGNSNRLYSINTTTGAATAVGSGPFTPTLNGSDFGGDFNPTVDRLRVVSDLDQNLRLNPSTGAVAATDTALAYAVGDVNFAANPNAVASAYTNSFAGSTTTTLYNIDSNLDVLVLQGSLNGTPVSPNSGQLTTIGALGVNTTGLVGFDIQGSTNRAVASLNSPGDTSSKFYDVNLNSGAATLIGTIGGPEIIRDIAVAAGSIQFSAATASVAEGGGHITLTVTRTGNTSIPATVNFASVDGTALQRTDFIVALGVLQFAAGETTKTIDLLIVDDVYVEGSETFNVTLSAPTGDFALSGDSTITITITDNDSVPPTTNPLEEAQFFVRQQYLDFLNREPDAGGLAFWTSQITSCGADAVCLVRKRVEVSAAFFGEPEFQGTGFLVFTAYKAGLNRQPTYVEFMRDRSQLPVGPNLENAKVAYFNAFVQRAEFITLFPTSLTPAEYVDGLNANTANSLTQAERDALVAGLTNATETRATVLRKVSENTVFGQRQTNAAFVLMEYFGYLRRDADPQGQAFWLSILDSSGNFRGMVCAFLTSLEYQARFSSIRTRTDSECAGL